MPQADGSSGGRLRMGLDMFYYLIFTAVAVRLTTQAVTQGFRPWLQAALLAAFLLLSLLQPVLHRRWPAAMQPILALAAAVTAALLFTKPRLDYYALLYVGLSLSVTRYLPLRANPYWLGGFCVLLTGALLAVFGWSEGVPYVPVYIAGVLVIGLYGRANRKAEEARARSEELAARLQEANRRLQIYAERAEEVATAQERTRLARELHDAVTQTVFSINLTAEAARLACDQSPERVPGMLDRLQELGREALGEMRSLVDELRPHAVADVGLVGSLEKHLAMRRRRDELEVSLEVVGKERGELPVKEALFRTAQEALNNVLRHSGVRSAAIRLAFEERAVTLRVSDDGRGFTPAQAPGTTPVQTSGGESFGLINMRERVETLGGDFHLRTAPGVGTVIEARVPLRGGGEE